MPFSKRQYGMITILNMPLSKLLHILIEFRKQDSLTQQQRILVLKQRIHGSSSVLCSTAM